MIRETSLEIDTTLRRDQAEIELRHARRNKVRYIDHLLNELETLNLADHGVMPATLRDEVRGFLTDNGHSPRWSAAHGLTIPDCMEALYDIQDTLLLGSDQEEDDR